MRTQVAERYRDAKSFGDVGAALNQFAPAAAVIATPAPFHVSQAIDLARRGAHLLIEKPLSVSMDSVDELAAASSRVRIAVAYVYRAHPALAAIRDAIASDRFGKPVEIVAVCGQNFPHYRPAYREIYYAKHASGGGAVQDALTHVINAGEWLVGPIARLAADAGRQVLEGVDVEDTVHVIARHGDVMGSYSLNQHQAPNETTITVVCERGTARFEFHRGRWSWMEKPDTPWNEEPSATLATDGLFVRQANAFLDAVEGKAPPLCPLGEGVQTLKVNLAILRAAAEARWEVVP